MAASKADAAYVHSASSADEIVSGMGRLSVHDTLDSRSSIMSIWPPSGTCYHATIPQSTFDGTQSKLEDFLLQVETQFHFHPSWFVSEADKVLYTAAFLRDKAAKGFNPYVREWFDSNGRPAGTETKQIFGDFGLFKAKLHNLYGVLDKSALADQHIRRLRQTNSVSIYAAEFLRWAAELDWNDAALRSQFLIGLHGDIKSELIKDSRCDDLPGMIMAARMIDERSGLLSQCMTETHATSRAWTRCFSCQGFGHIARYCPYR